MLTKEEAQGQTHESIQDIVDREYPKLQKTVDNSILRAVDKGEFQTFIFPDNYHTETTAKMISELRNRGFVATVGIAKSIRIAWMN